MKEASVDPSSLELTKAKLRAITALIAGQNEITLNAEETLGLYNILNELAEEIDGVVS